MKFATTPLKDMLLLTPTIHRDERGTLFESFNQRDFAAAIGQDLSFVQDNHSLSKQNVLRGLHFQIKQPQGKLVRVLRGRIYDVSVDLRPNSPSRGQCFGIELDAELHQQVWLPPGFAHGFLTLSAESEVLYKLTSLYQADLQRTLSWNDPAVAIDWPVKTAPILSEKDRLQTLDLTAALAAQADQ